MLGPRFETDGVQPLSRRWRAYAAMSIAAVMSVLDGSIANVALPTIARDLHVGASTIVWVVNAFNLAVTAALFAAAAYGASIGFTRMYRAGVVVFTFGSILCALSGSFPLLIGARVVQGVGAAMIMAISPAIVRSIFPSSQLVQAFGWNALVVSVAATAGPTAGGLLLTVLPWPWLFGINLPFAILTIVLGAGAMPETPGTGARHDALSVIASALGFSALIYGIDGFSRHEGLLPIALETGVGALVFGWFVRRQFTLRQPMIALDLFRIPVFAGAATTSFAAWTAWGIAFVTLPFILQLDRGLSPLVSGLLLTTLPVGTGISAPLAARLAGRVSVRALASGGLAVFGVGLALYAVFADVAPPAALLAFGALAGFGFGCFQAPNNGELLGSAPVEKSGSASALLATMRVGAQTVGASIVAIVFAWAERGAHGALAETGGPVALGIAAACAGGAAVISVRRDVRLQPA